MLKTDCNQLALEVVKFDTEHFGFRCATVNVPAGVVITPDAVDELKSRARVENIKFLTVMSRSAILNLEQHSHGVLSEYIAPFEEVRNRASVFPRRFHVEPFNDNNWKDVVQLTKFRSSNRFSKDSHFDEAAVFEHKVKLFRLQWQRFPKLAYLAYSKQSEPVGFHICVRDKYAVNQYDMVVRPDYRTGTLAFDLINAGLKAAYHDDNSVKLVSTRIYDDNGQAVRFFSKLGLKRNGSEFNYYHFWF